MIRFEDVRKAYRTPKGSRHVLRGMTLALPQDRNVGIVGRNGAGKSTLLKMISGVVRPDSGRIERSCRVSWPLGFAGGFHPALTGRQNARFVARVYGADTDRLVAFVDEFAGLGEFLDMPFDTYSTGMRARLAFGVSMAADFDCYLVDEITAVGDADFRQKCTHYLKSKLSYAQVIMVSHTEETLRQYCDSVLLLDDGHAWYFDSLDEGLEAYRARPASRPH